MDDSLDVAKDISNYIRYFLKGTQEEIDNQFPQNDDNSETDFNVVTINDSFHGTCIRSITTNQANASKYNGISFTGYFKYELIVNQMGNEFIDNIEFLGGNSYFTGYSSEIVSFYNAYADCVNNDILYTCKIKDELKDGEWFFPYNGGDSLRSLTIKQNDFNYTNVSNTSLTTLANEYTAQKFAVRPWNLRYSISESQYGLQTCTPTLNGLSADSISTGNSYIYQHTFTSQEPALYITTDSTFNNRIQNYYYGDTITTNNYIDSHNNSYNVYNGDNFIAVAPVVGAGGIANFNLNFDDLIGALQLAVDDINVRLGLSGGDLITVPTYDEIKYEDMGSFYITPIKQIDTLPFAPDIADTVIDVSEPLDILSSGFGALLDSFNNIGVTLTLTFTFLSCLIINKLRGD